MEDCLYGSFCRKESSLLPLGLSAKEKNKSVLLKKRNIGSILGDFEAEKKQNFYAKLFKVDGKELIVPEEKFMEELKAKNKLDNFYFISDKQHAEDIKSQILKENFSIKSITKKESKRNPPSPFITSSMQQEASRRLKIFCKKNHDDCPAAL